MDRKEFLTRAGITVAGIVLRYNTMARHTSIEPELLYFKDDGAIPNSRYPLLVYRSAFTERGTDGAIWLEETFAANQWTNPWRNGVYNFHHYHSTAHEVLGIYRGGALLHLGGEQGQQVRVEAGDILIIPAGVGHKSLETERRFAVVGAYAGGREYDVRRGRPEDRPEVLSNIADVPLPAADPLLGKDAGLITHWK